jgi:hypothetical protein
MKKAFLVTSLLVSSLAYADVDYSRCLVATGINGGTFDNDGQFLPSKWQKLKSKTTDGNKETYILESVPYGGLSEVVTNEVVIERDDQGKIIKASTGGDKMDPKSIQQYRDRMIDTSINGNTLAGINTYEPQIYLDGKAVSLSNLTKKQAESTGFKGNFEQIKKLKTQWRKDKKIVQQIKDAYSKILDSSSLLIPMGQEANFEIKDGVCLVKDVAYKKYDPKSKQVVKVAGISRQDCENAQIIHKKYEAKLNECNLVDGKIAQEYSVKGINAHTGGIAGGNMGGFPGGMGNGYGGGMLGGSGSQPTLPMYHCNMLYGVGPIGMGGMVGGIKGGSLKGSKQ